LTEDRKDPIESVRRMARVELPKRFYKRATAEPEGARFVLKLDGRSAKTPAKKLLAVPCIRLAEALAAEWNSTGEHIDPGKMPLTRIVNVAIDRVAEEMAPVRSDIVNYARSDLLCYRADGPAGLIAAEEGAWSPLLAWARNALGARFVLAEGVMHVAQDRTVLAAIERALVPLDPLGLAALHVVTTLTGSAVVALALARRHIDADEAWTAAHVDEDWQMHQWGADEAALARRASRRSEMDAAALILSEA
jgi:chaperone required for assembly of F1-ATPase